MYDQEIASLIKFLLSAAGDPYPYYWYVPDGFRVPSMYFPVPEMSSGGDTLSTYSLEYTWYIKCFGKDDASAQALAAKAVEAIRAVRNRIPLIDDTGATLKKWLRVDDPQMNRIDTGTYQVMITYTVRRPYTKEEVDLTQRFFYSLHNRYADAETEEAPAQVHYPEETT